MLRLSLRQQDHAEQKAKNKHRKIKERRRREARMVETIKARGSLPYTPDVMSWLSLKLDKPATCLTESDVKSVLA
jgi:hypothetical protein